MIHRALATAALAGLLAISSSASADEISTETISALMTDGNTHLGEPVMFLGIGVVWLAGLALSLRASRIRPVINSLLITGCIGVTAFFGIVVDEMVVYGPHTDAMIEIEAFIEDGGEFAMIVIAFLLTVAMFDVERRRAAAIDSAEQALAELPRAA
jgi:hypothetical protein